MALISVSMAAAMPGRRMPCVPSAVRQFMTLPGDMLKCLVATLVVRLIFGTSHEDIVPVLCAYAAAGAILGHNFPFYMNFKGGKGVACTVGLVFCLSWQVGLVVMVEFFLFFFASHYVSLCSILCYVLS